ncbi:MAG: hypothetical protein SPH12_00405 [Veillonella caviae]|nr:hypothetical protein [Veillonella caviae]
MILPLSVTSTFFFILNVRKIRPTSLERLPDLDAGYLVVTAGYGSTSSNNSNIAMERLTNMEKDDLWKNLTAVKEKHVLLVDSSLWLAHGIIAKELAMDDLYNAWGK